MTTGVLTRQATDWQRLARFATFALVVVGLLEFGLVHRAIVGGWHGPYGQDVDAYLAFTRTWLSSGSWYLPEQLTGPYGVEALTGNVYPPTLLYVTVPFALGLPLILWWAIPLGIIAAALRHVRPAWWAWPLIAAVLIYPRTWTVLVLGNPAMWAIAFAVAGVAWSWPAIGATLKLTFAPLALIGIRHRSWWIAATVGLALALPFGGLWLDYIAALVNGQSSRGLGYVLGEWPIALALVGASATGYLNSDRITRAILRRA